MLYYWGWNIIYAIIMKLLFKLGLTIINVPINLKAIFWLPFVDGQQFYLNAPSWFLPTLFTIEILYWFIRKVGKGKVYNSSVLLFFFIINILSVKLSIIGNFSVNLLPIIKLMFFMIFYILGFYYKLYYEKTDEKTNSLIVMGILMIINSLIIKWNPNIHFSSLYSMSGFGNSSCLAPIITGITGIYFFLKLSQLLLNSLQDNKIVNLISNYTKEICMHHIFCMYCLSIIIYLLNFKFNFVLYDEIYFKKIPGWYFYYFNNRTFSIIYFFVGIFGSIGIEKLIKKIGHNIVRGVSK